MNTFPVMGSLTLWETRMSTVNFIKLDLQFSQIKFGEKKKKKDKTQVLRKSLESNFMANKRGNLLNALKRANVKEIQDIRKKLFIQIK